MDKSEFDGQLFAWGDSVVADERRPTDVVGFDQDDSHVQSVNNIFDRRASAKLDADEGVMNAEICRDLWNDVVGEVHRNVKRHEVDSTRHSSVNFAKRFGIALVVQNVLGWEGDYDMGSLRGSENSF